jgi:hypothetical protein
MSGVFLLETNMSGPGSITAIVSEATAQLPDATRWDAPLDRKEVPLPRYAMYGFTYEDAGDSD